MSNVKKCDEEKLVDNAMLQNVLVIIALTNEILHVRQISQLFCDRP